MNKKLLKQILEMKEVDQDLRLKTKPGKDIGNYLIYIVDAIHNYKIKRIINEYGYPNEKMLGKKGMAAFWLLIQHQDQDIDLQKECLRKVNFKPKFLAYLTDRVNINEGKPQLFGTQFYINKQGKFIPRPIKDRKNLEKRRKEYGMGPFKEYKKIMMKIYDKNKKRTIKK